MMGGFIEEDFQPQSLSVSTSKKGTTYFGRSTNGSAATTRGGNHLPIKLYDRGTFG